MRRRIKLVLAAFSILLPATAALAPTAAAQSQDRPLRPAPPRGLPVIPYMEGWYDNEDGSVTISFGYHNRNEQTVAVRRGENNRIEPPRLDGMQPEHFLPGRHPGVFAVTIPPDLEGATIWWHLASGGSELEVPGERGSEAYQLDRNPRPQGSVQPEIWFDGGERGSGPEGVVAADVLTATVGEPLALEVWTRDPSVRDPTDPRFVRPLDTHVSWYEHQGPAPADFAEDASTPFSELSGTPVLGLIPVAEARVAVTAGQGPARVFATFSEPGDYMVRARLDNWNASDSDGLDQCCWSNAYQRVRVTQRRD